MKTKFLLLVCLIGLCLGCKKSADPDPRDNFVGTWKQISLNGKTPSNPNSFTIKKETAATAISMNWYEKSTTDYAKLTSNNTGFTFDKITYILDSDYIDSDGKRYKLEFKNGKAELNNTTLKLSFDILVTNLNNGQSVLLTGSDGWIEEYTKQ